MLGLLNILDIAFLGVIAFTDVQVQLAETVYLPAAGQVVKVEFRPGTAIWNKTYKCRYHGLLVPFERDWEEEMGGFENKTMRPPEPGKLAGYAIVINKLACPGKDAEFVMNTATHWSTAPAGRPLLELRTFASVGLNPNPELRPKWFSQVLRTIEVTAEKDQVAKEFVEFSRVGQEMLKAKAETAKAAQAQTINAEVNPEIPAMPAQ